MLPNCWKQCKKKHCNHTNCKYTKAYTYTTVKIKANAIVNYVLVIGNTNSDSFVWPT